MEHVIFITHTNKKSKSTSITWRTTGLELVLLKRALEFIPEHTLTLSNKGNTRMLFNFASIVYKTWKLYSAALVYKYLGL